MIAASVASVVWFLLLSLGFNAQLKIWYLYWALPILAMVWGWLIGKLNKVIVVAILVVVGMIQASRVANDFRARKLDMKMLHQQKFVVAQVLAMGKNEIYEAYVYTEPIYDYQYQFLWWWNRQETGEGPVAYGYLPDKYDYVLNKRRYDPKPHKVNTIYLIMEKDNPASDYRWETWLKAFYEFEPTDIMVLPNGVRIEKRVRATQSL